MLSSVRHLVITCNQLARPGERTRPGEDPFGESRGVLVSRSDHQERLDLISDPKVGIAILYLHSRRSRSAAGRERVPIRGLIRQRWISFTDYAD